MSIPAVLRPASLKSIAWDTMIAYDLQCVNNHSFEGWFEDEKAYSDQKKKGLVACPICNDTAVARIPSTFAIKSSQVGRPSDPAKAGLAALGKQIVDYVEKNFDNVGCDFAKEALKMHYGVKKPRNIRGTSTKDEEKTLKEEGIQYFKIPTSVSQDTDS